MSLERVVAGDEPAYFPANIQADFGAAAILDAGGRARVLLTIQTLYGVEAPKGLLGADQDLPETVTHILEIHAQFRHRMGGKKREWRFPGQVEPLVLPRKQ